MNTKSHILWIILLTQLCFLSEGSGQLINIESRRMQTDSIRFAGRGEVAGLYNDVNGSYIFNISAATATQLKSKSLKDIFLILGNYNAIFSKAVTYQNSWMAHVRYNRKITPLLRVESFLQSSGNQVLDVSKRNLAGAGIRMKLLAHDHFNLYMGHSYMLEYERSNAVQRSNYNHRHNAYLSWTLSFRNQGLEWSNTTYWQPKYAAVEDFNLLNQFKLDFKLSEIVQLFGILDYYIDTDTPSGTQQYYFLTRLGMGVSY